MSDNSDPNKLHRELIYLDDYSQLPARAPFGCPHIVDIENLSEDFLQAEVGIPELVVTVLYKYRPAALRAFLDLERPEVHFVRHNGGRQVDFCIQRQGRVVKVHKSIQSNIHAIDNLQIGFLNERAIGGWVERYKYRIDASATGNWSPIHWQGGDRQTYHDQMITRAVPAFAFDVASMRVWEIEQPDVEFEWFGGLLQGRGV